MKIYVDQKTKLADMKSTAWSFLVIGVLGLILLVLLWLGVLPVSLVPETKVILTVVMGALFLFFTGTGIQSFCSLKKLKAAAEEETDTYSKITAWFLLNHAEQVKAYEFEEKRPELLYFPRYQMITTIISSEYPDLPEEFLDHIAEDLYAKIFPENK